MRLVLLFDRFCKERSLQNKSQLGFKKDFLLFIQCHAQIKLTKLGKGILLDSGTRIPESIKKVSVETKIIEDYIKLPTHSTRTSS